MRWVAPTEKDDANHQLEKRLWAAADQFRANSGLKAAQYSAPVLGLIFLRFAEARFAQRRAQLEKAGASPSACRAPTTPTTSGSSSSIQRLRRRPAASSGNRCDYNTL